MSHTLVGLRKSMVLAKFFDRFRRIWHLVKHVCSRLRYLKICILMRVITSTIVWRLPVLDCRRRHVLLSVRTCIRTNLWWSKSFSVLLTVSLLVLVYHVLDREWLFLLISSGRIILLSLMVRIRVHFTHALLFLAFRASTRVTSRWWILWGAGRTDTCSHFLSTLTWGILDARNVLLWSDPGWRKRRLRHSKRRLHLIEGRSSSFERRIHVLVIGHVLLQGTTCRPLIVWCDRVVVVVFTINGLPQEKMLGRSLGTAVDNPHGTSILCWLFVVLVNALRFKSLLALEQLDLWRQVMVLRVLVRGYWV